MKTSHRVFIITDVHVCALDTKKIIKLKNFTLFGGGWYIGNQNDFYNLGLHFLIKPGISTEKNDMLC